MATYTQPTVKEQLKSVENRPLLQRCSKMEEILETTGPKELKAVFPCLLHEIFDFERDSGKGWKLDTVQRSNSPELFARIRKLHSPEGPLMKLINILHTDPYATYQFSLKHVPAPSRHLIEEGAIPSFYANKIQNPNYNVPVLILNAFELYMFHLTYALVSPLWQMRNQGWVDLYEFVYPAIIDDLLTYFLPCDKSSLPSVSVNSSTVRLPVGASSPNRLFGSPTTQQFPNTSPYIGTSPGLHHHTLFKAGFINDQKQHQQNIPVLDQAETETWRSETFLQVLVEFWLNQSSLNEMGGSPHSLGIPEHFLPTMNHVKMVRLLVKYVHNFTNSAASIVTSPFQQSVLSPLDQFKKSVVPHILQKKLYSFLRHAFSRWPLDSCFRMVLETWLSYIQPWRYVDFTKRNDLDSQPSDTDQGKQVDSKWESFVEENLLFYTVLTAEFLPRIFRMDLTSPYSAYMVYRVSRILSLPDLPKLIAKAEHMLFGVTHHVPDLGGSYISSHSYYSPASLPSQMIDLEEPNFQYTPFFGDTMKMNMVKVIQQLYRALDNVKLEETERAIKSKQENSSSSFFSLLFGSGNSDGFSASQEFKRLPIHLEQAVNNFCGIYSFRVRETLNSNEAPNLSIVNESTYLTEKGTDLPDCVQTEQGLKLTDRGRWQVINHERSFHQFYTGDPDLLPVRSYENATLVRLLFHFCAFINSNFHNEFNKLFYRQDFVGRFFHVYLRSPISPQQQQSRSPIVDRANMKVIKQSYEPHISLRFLASYRNLVLCGLAYIVFSMIFDVGPLGFFFIVVLLTVLYGCFFATIHSFTNSWTIVS